MTAGVDQVLADLGICINRLELRIAALETTEATTLQSLTVQELMRRMSVSPDSGLWGAVFDRLRKLEAKEVEPPKLEAKEVEPPIVIDAPKGSVLIFQVTAVNDATVARLREVLVDYTVLVTYRGLDLVHVLTP